MSHNVFNYYNDYCMATRGKDYIKLSPRDCMSGVSLSDDRMNILFQMYTQLLLEEQKEGR